MRLFSYNNPELLTTQLQKLTGNQLAKTYKSQLYDYVWAKQNIHNNQLNNYKTNKIKAKQQLTRAASILAASIFIIFLITWAKAWNYLLYTGFISILLVIGFIIIVYVLSSILFYISSQRKIDFKRYCYYLNKNYLIVLLEDIDKIKMDKIVDLSTLSVVEWDKNSVKIYTDTLNPIIIYCDNAEEIADFIQQQIPKTE